MSTVLIQNRRGTSTEWSAGNPILAAGEIGYETDSGKTKIGNGASQWSALPYSSTDISTLATQASLDATDALVALNATQVSLDATDALVALKAPIDDPTFTTGITTPKIEVTTGAGTPVGIITDYPTPGMSIVPSGSGPLHISSDVNLASGKEYKVNGVAIGAIGGGLTWSAVAGGGITTVAGNGYFVDTSGGATYYQCLTPSSASVGDEVYLIDHKSTWGTLPLRVEWNGLLFEGGPGLGYGYTEWGSASGTSLGSICFIYSGATIGWVIKSTTLSANHV